MVELAHRVAERVAVMVKLGDDAAVLLAELGADGGVHVELVAVAAKVVGDAQRLTRSFLRRSPRHLRRLIRPLLVVPDDARVAGEPPRQLVVVVVVVVACRGGGGSPAPPRGLHARARLSRPPLATDPHGSLLPRGGGRLLPGRACLDVDGHVVYIRATRRAIGR